MEDFSADIAHELRTPINNLMLLTQITLSRRREAGEHEEALHSRLAELERLQRMMSGMLFLARVDRGMLRLERDSADLAQETAEVVDFSDAAVAERAQRIQVSGSAAALCDRDMARRAITTLVSNAVRYAPPGAMVRIALSNDNATAPAGRKQATGGDRSSTRAVAVEGPAEPRRSRRTTIRWRQTPALSRAATGPPS